MQIPCTNERLIVSGPYIQFLGYEPSNMLWRAAVMVLSPPVQLTVLAGQPILYFYNEGVPNPDQTCMSCWGTQVAKVTTVYKSMVLPYNVLDAHHALHAHRCEVSNAE